MELPAPFLLHGFEISRMPPAQVPSPGMVCLGCESPGAGSCHGLGWSPGTRELKAEEF